MASCLTNVTIELSETTHGSFQDAAKTSLNKATKIVK